MKKDKMIAFMSKHNIETLNMIPAKSVLLEKIIFKNIKKQYAIDSMSEKVGYSVLRLSPYRFILNPVEMKCPSLNVYTSKSSKVVNLSWKVRKEYISPENWD